LGNQINQNSNWVHKLGSLPHTFFCPRTYLAGGVAFGPPDHPIVSDNLTPDVHGKPEGLSWEQFVSALRTGHDPKTGDLLQVMPWPVYRNMTDRDLRAIYEFLRAIPHADQPTDHCTMPGQ